MAKKSRKAAAKYSELSRERKKKQKNRQDLQPRAVVAPKTREAVEPPVARKPVASAVTKRQSGMAQHLPVNPYVRADLRRIGILAGGALVILIVLTFILG